MKVSDIQNLVDQLTESNIPMRDQLVLEISRDDATELLIDMIELELWSAGGLERMRVDRYISGNIAYKMFVNCTLFGLKIMAP